MGIDWAVARFVLDVMVMFAVLGSTIYTWVVNRSKANKSAIDRVGAQVHGLSGRLDVLESEVRHLPNHDDLGRLHEKVNQVANSMQRIDGELSGIHRTLGLIHESLLAERKGQ